MAKQVPHGLITCGQCQKQISDPKQLPCLHTFCSPCVSELSAKYSSCPSCRFRLSDAGDSRTFPHDSFIDSLLKLSLDDPQTDNAPDKCSPMFQASQKDCEKNLEALVSSSEDLSNSVLVAKQHLSLEKQQTSDAICAFFADLRTRMNDYITGQERTLLSDLEAKCDTKTTEYDQMTEWGKSIHQTTESLHQLLDAVNVHANKGNEEIYRNVLCEMNIQVRNFDYRMKTETNKISQPVSLKFEPNPEVERTITNKSLGRLQTEGFQNVEVPQTSRMPGNPNIVYQYSVLQMGFSARFPDDSRSGYIVGLTWIPPDHLLAVDKWNNRLKLFHESGEARFCVNVMGGEPTDIAYTKSVQLESGNRHFCVVTIPGASAIVQVIIESDRMSLSKHISTAVGYSSVAYDRLNAQLVCGVCPPYGQPRVDIIISNGTIVKSFAVDGTGMPLFSSPRSLDVDDEGRIVVCDWKRNHLVFLANDGLILGSYKGHLANHLMDPIGTSLDDCGHVLVADLRAKKIKVIDFAGDFRCTLQLDEVNFTPREINLRRVGEDVKLAVSQNEGMISWYKLYPKQ